MVISTYSEAELNRLKPIRRALRDCPTAVKVWMRPLDDRMDTGTGRRKRPCHAPLYDLTIYPTGRIGLCCMDWDQRGTFGDLTKTPFAEAMTAALPRMRELEQNLERKRRKLDVCLVCRVRRGMFGYPAERKTSVDTAPAT